MATLKWLLCVSFAVTTLPAAYPEPHCPGNVAIVRLRLGQRSQIVVRVAVNHKGPYDFVVDTGSQVSSISPDLAADLQLQTGATMEIMGVGHSQASLSRVDLLQAGSHEVSNLLVTVQNLEYLGEGHLRIRGILGGNFLEHFDVLIDYGQSVLCLDEAKVMQSHVRGEHIPLVPVRPTGEEGAFTAPLIVQGQLSGRHTLLSRFLLDSGANSPLLFRAGAAHQRVSAPLGGRGIDGREHTVAILRPQDLRVGTKALHEISFIVPVETENEAQPRDFDGLLPTVLFQRVYVSYLDRFAVLDPQ